MGREHVIVVRLNEDELAALDEMATTDDRTRSGMIRRLIAEAIEARKPSRGEPR
jgi:predicted transcriptional regulator